MRDEPVLHDFDYLNDIPIQRSILSVTTEKVQPVSTPKRDSDIIFDIKQSVAFTALHQSKLVVEVKVTKEKKVDCNHAATSNADTVTVVNNLFHSMWKTISTEINGHSVETVTHYPYRAYIDTLTSFSKEVMAVRGVIQGWSKDTAGKMHVTTTGGDNLGATERGNMIASSRTFKMKGRLLTDLWLQGRSIPPDTTIKISLTPSEDNFVLLGDAGTNYELHIERAYLEIVRQHVPPSLTAAVNAYKGNKPLAVNYRKVCITSHNLKVGEAESVVDLFESEKALPDRFFVCFVNHEAYAGSINANPFNFETLGINSLSVNFNGTTLSGQTYNPNFSRNVVDEYVALLEEFGANEENHVLNITPKEFAAGYAIFPFRLVSRTSGGECLGPQATGSVSLKVKFLTALSKVVTIIVLAEYRSTLEFRKRGEVSQAQ